MDRFKIFHHIATKGTLTSVSSILFTGLTELNSAFGASTAAYFATGAGGVRCLAAYDQTGREVSAKKFMANIIGRAVRSGQPAQTDLPALASGGGFQTGRSNTRVYIAVVPLVEDQTVTGVVYLERQARHAPFQADEIEALGGVGADLQKLLYSSGDFEKQSFELDTVRSQAAMSKVNLISNHPVMINLFGYIQKLAKVPSTVLIRGESGTGKELVARAIFELGAYDGPFVSMNCGGIEPNLLKSELFGHLKGSYSGAHKDRAGLFKKAEHGVLFMDEIGEMPMDMQIAMLRTLQCGEILPVGADLPVRVKTRVVAATHRDLKEMVAAGKFRNDLYQRLKGLTLIVPPLRERRTDIPLLCQHFVAKYNERLSVDFRGLREEALELLKSRDFAQGNVRELEHMIERAMVFEDDEDTIGTKYLLMEQPMAESAAPGTDAGSFEERMNRHAAQIIRESLAACNGNKTKAMKMLGLSRSTFYSMLNRHGIQ